MKKLLFIAVICCIGCQNSYQKANTQLDFLKKNLNAIDSLNRKPPSPGNDSAISYHMIMVEAFKNEFQKTIMSVSDQKQQLELIKKFDRIYVLRIEK